MCYSCLDVPKVGAAWGAASLHPALLPSTCQRMFRLPVDMLAPGMVSAQPVSDPARRDRTLVPDNEELSARSVSTLRSSGIEAIWVRVEELAHLEELIRQELGTHNGDVRLCVREGFLERLRTTTIDVDLGRLRRVWAELFAYLAAHASTEELIAKMLFFDGALAAHALDVSFLSTLLGLRLEPQIARQRRRCDRKAGADLHLLTLGCLLHDIGKISTPGEILHKPGKLDRRETMEMQRHTTRGYEMLRGKTHADVAEVALHHHQRWDGRGYPRTFECATLGRRTRALAGEEIPVFARIATVVDVFDAAISRRCYRDAKSPRSALREMRRQARGFFEPNLVECALVGVLCPAMADRADGAASSPCGAASHARSESPDACGPSVAAADPTETLQAAGGS